MTNKIDRREFIRRGTGIGVALLAQDKLGATHRKAGEGNSAKPHIVAVEGDDPLKSIAKALQLMGGIRRFIPHDSRVALLPNAQSRHPGCFTHPDVLKAVVRLCKAAGAGDIKALSWLPINFWSATGLDKLLAAEGAGLLICGREDENFYAVPLQQGKNLKTAYLQKALSEFDLLINIPIIKDHVGNKFTGTMKNLMGLNSPNCNRTFHQENWDTEPSALAYLDQCIADLNLAVTPKLNIADATEIITTNGPFGPGKLIRPGKVVVGTDRVAIDSYCTSFLGLSPEDVIMIKRGAAHGLGEMDLAKVRVTESRI